MPAARCVSWRLATLAFSLLSVVPLAARAQLAGVPVVLVRAAGQPNAPAPLPAEGRWLQGEALSRALESLVGREPSPLPSGEVRARAEAAQRTWVERGGVGDAAGAARALEELYAALQALIEQGDSLRRSPESRVQLRAGLLFLAHRAMEQGDVQRARSLAQQLAVVEPGLALTNREASPELQRLYAEAVQQLPSASLRVESASAGCEVWRDGAVAGAAPLELERLAPGPHFLWLQCAGLRSREHRVVLQAGTRQTLALDAALDAAFSASEGLGLTYATEADREARSRRDLLALGGVLGASRVVAWLPARGEFLVLDVPRAQELPRVPATEPRALLALLGGAPALSGPRAPVAVAPAAPVRPSARPWRELLGVGAGLLALGKGLGASEPGLRYLVLTNGANGEDGATRELREGGERAVVVGALVFGVAGLACTILGGVWSRPTPAAAP